MIAHQNCSCCTSGFPSRRRVLGTFVATAATLAAAAATGAASTSPDDETFMRIAIEEARQGDFPYGAVIVRDRQVIARGRNLGLKLDDPTAHGEIQAIRHGLAQHGSKGLQGTTLYTSGEPCAMCMGAIIWCRFDRLVYAASIDQISTRTSQLTMPSAEVADKSPFPKIAITGGVLAEEALRLF
jgi:tRNA(adenine34) deaminase